MKNFLSKPGEKKVAKNTLLLFVRMALLMVINLVAVRYVRQGLGLEDYGILNAVTGIVQIVICLKSILATATQRFISMIFILGVISKFIVGLATRVILQR